MATRHNILLRPPERNVQAPADDIERIIAKLDETRAAIADQVRTTALIAAPWLTMPPDGESFHQAAGIGLTPKADGLFHVVVQIVCPEGRNGVLNRIANEFVGGGFTDFSGSIIWQIQRNPGTGQQTAERNYENIVAALGSVANPAAIAPIRIFENDVITLVITNVSIVVAGQLVGGLLGGWFYPKTWDDAFERAQKYEAVSW